MMRGPAERQAVSAYQRLADELRRAIMGGVYPPGAMLPSESELVDRHKVSRGTVRQTYGQLEREGLVASQRGRRRTVVSAPRIQSFGHLISFSLWVRSLGERPGGVLIRLMRRRASEEEVRALEIEPGAPVVAMVRLRLIAEEPVMVERSVYPEGPGRIVAAMALDEESITERLGSLGHVFAHASHVIDALAAGAEDARLLRIRPRSPLLRARRLTTDPRGRPIEWADDRYRADALAFTVSNSLQSTSLGLLAARR